MTKPRPFNFDEFRASAGRSDGAPRAETHSAEDIAAARAQGVAEGRRLAMESIAADETDQLRKIGDALIEAHEAHRGEILRVRGAILAVARVFLEEFAAGLASAREVEVAEDLLRRLTENSEDRRSARLIVNAKSLERLRVRLEEALNRRGVGDFVSLEGDHRIKPGEARLEWRGGAAHRTRAEINAAIAALLDPLSQEEMEPHHERA